MLQNMYAGARTHTRRAAATSVIAIVVAPTHPPPPVGNRNLGDTGTFSSIQKDEIMPVDLATSLVAIVTRHPMNPNFEEPASFSSIQKG
jgi:hypothetical protein